MRANRHIMNTALVAVAAVILLAAPAYSVSDDCCPPDQGKCCPPGTKVVRFDCKTVEECKAACEADLGPGYTVTTESVKPLRFRIRPKTPESEASTPAVEAKLAQLRARRLTGVSTDDPCCDVMDPVCCAGAKVDCATIDVNCPTEDLKRCVEAAVEKTRGKTADKSKKTYGPF